MALDRTRAGIVAVLLGLALAAVVGVLDWQWTGRVHLRLLLAAFAGGSFLGQRLAESTERVDDVRRSPSVLDLETPHQDIENVPIVPGGAPIRLPGPR